MVKYLFILFCIFLISCSPSEKEIKIEHEKIEKKIQEAKPIALTYLNKCYKHWSGYYVHTWRTAEEGGYKLMKDGLSKCSISLVCDVNNPKKCINHKICGGWTRYDYVVEMHNKMNLKEEVPCPDSRKPNSITY